MRTVLRTPRRKYRRCPWRAIGLFVEALESRTLPDANTFSGLFSLLREAEPNDTLDQAQGLGNLSTLRQVEVDGRIGNGTTGAADVDWYRFTLDRPSRVTLAALTRARHSSLVSVVGLYGSDAQNLKGPIGHAGYRPLVQDDGAGHDGDARIDRSLAAGTYFVAVSGSGNRYFHPLIAGSGYPGSTGDYGLVVTASDLDFRPTDGPAVLAVDPAPEADLDRSPFVIRIHFSTALDPSSLRLGQNVRLTATFGVPPGGGAGQIVSVASSSFNTSTNELQLTPAAPLRPGRYELFLAGNRTVNQPVLTDPAGNPLGKSDVHPSGDDYTASFRVGGVKGNRAADAGADDTPATARTLGELAGAGLVQVAGAIGNDPTDPVPFNRADVDLYHFPLRGTGRFAFTAEVFAGRIGSPLDPAASLFRLDPADRQLHFVASNDNSFNRTVTHDGAFPPLFVDPIVNAGLTEGDYYLAVSASANLPMPAFGRLPGTGGVFDPNVSHSGKRGSTIGDYILNVAAEPMNDPPHVSAVPTMDGTSLNQGTLLPAPPTRLSVTFDKTINLRQLVHPNGLSDAIYIQDSQGSKFFPQLVDYADTGKRAEFMMLDALPNDVYQLHLSGRLGFTDLASNPLVGNDSSGDYVIRFTVNGPPRGLNGNPRVWLDQEPNDDPAHPQDLGVLFPTELTEFTTGILLQRGSPVADASDTADYYRFRVLQKTQYWLEILNSSIAPAGIRLTLTDVSGNPIRLAGDSVRTAPLDPGTYIVGIAGWSSAVAAKVLYQLSITANRIEPAFPLSIGPRPAIWIRHITGGPPALFGPPASPDDNSGTRSATVSPTPTGRTPSGPSVLPVSASIGPISLAKNAPGGVPDVAAIPSSVFLVLAAGPIGGIGTAGTPNAPRPRDLYETVLARTPDLLLSEIVVKLPLLIPQHSGTQQGAPVPDELLQWLQGVLRKFDKFHWARAAELFYGSQQWHENTLIRPAKLLTEDMPESIPPDEIEEEQTSAAVDNLNEEEILEHTASPAWAVAVALAAITARERARRQGLCGGDREGPG